MPSSAAKPEFGVLTLATPKDYVKAIGLALSLRISNPGVPVAVACSARIAPRLAPYFDFIIQERPELKGFVHKVYLDEYSPFDKTFFFDSDVFVFKPLDPFVKRWSAWPYAAYGKYKSIGKSTFGLDRAKVLEKIKKPDLVAIDGAGHAFFKKPECTEIFNLAREVTAKHMEYAGPIPYADEDVLDIVLTMKDIPPMRDAHFFSRYVSAVPGTLRLDVTRGLCELREVADGSHQQPCMMHFAADEAPLAYHWQLFKLFRAHGVPVGPIWPSFWMDAVSNYVKLPLHHLKKSWRTALRR